ncbi:MAG: phosphate/phosphite/phosphonate ABC transporter substrate-binding protein [Thiohalomonadales bacterium]
MAFIEDNKKLVMTSLVVGTLLLMLLIGYTIVSVVGYDGMDDIPISSDQTLILGVFPRRNSAKTIRMFNPIAQYISRKIGMKVVIETSNDFYTFWNNVKAKKYDIVHYNQLHYVLSNKKQGYTIILKNNEFGSSVIKPTITVRGDSKIKSIKDLKNKTIHFGGGRLAMASHVANRVAIREQGIDDNDYKWTYAKNPPEATRSVYNLIADAASIGDVILKFPELKRSINVNNFRKIYTGPDLPQLPWAVSDKITPDLAIKIQTAMMLLNDTEEGSSILTNASLTGLMIATDKEYDVVRDIYRKYTKYNQTH